LSLTGGGASELAISGPVTHAEGNSGTTVFTFTVTRSGNLNRSSTVDWSVTGSGANPASAEDFA
jgi:hypothetical protein